MNPFKKIIRRFKDWRIGRLPSRIFLQTTVIPALAAAGRQRMLFVGTRSYNRPSYVQCMASGISVWSIDLDPAAAAYGAPAGHFTGSICDIDKLADGSAFDVVVYNGVLGWGVNTPVDAIASLDAIRKVTTSSALMFIGWNPGKTDGAEVAALRAQLRRASLGVIPEEIEFPPTGGAQRYPHRYELFTFSDVP
ncbi:MAG: hypothetical protein K2P94_18970 [Rhodospirillaceae bacterium]|nr:hypothetical protein [Rhodospirillaceae bacterium]